MTISRPRPDPTQTLAAWAWALVALTPFGWSFGVLAIAYSHLGDVTDAGLMTAGVVLFAAAPASAVILAVHAARAGHGSGRAAVAVSGLLLLGTLAFSGWHSGGWVNVAGVAVLAVAAALALAWARSHGKPPRGKPSRGKPSRGKPSRGKPSRD